MKSSKVAAGILLLAVSARAQTSWERVLSVEKHQTVKIYLRNAEVRQGRIENSDPAGLTLLVGGGRILQVDRKDIVRVTRKSRAKGALWGGIILFGVTAPIGAYAGPYIADWGNPSASVRLRYAMGFGLFFGGIGAGAGALTGVESTLYRSGP